MLITFFNLFYYYFFFRNSPSSFKGCHGSIAYVLQAKLSRSWKIPQTVTKEFIFVSNDSENSSHLMVCAYNFKLHYIEPKQGRAVQCSAYLSHSFRILGSILLLLFMQTKLPQMYSHLTLSITCKYSSCSS